jgi:uncharacterized protein YndB with AHSA1/START domain
MSEFTETIHINAPVAEVWAVLADIGTISDWNPGVKASRQTTDGEVTNGSCRSCDLGGKNYLDEEVVSFEPSSKITFRITDTNLPFASADIRFNLMIEGNGTVVEVSPLYKLKFGLFGRILDVLAVSATYRKGMRDLLQGLKSHVEATAP